MLDLPAFLTYIGRTSITEGLRYARRIQEIHPAWKCCGYGGGRGDRRGVRGRGHGVYKGFADAADRGNRGQAGFFLSRIQYSRHTVSGGRFYQCVRIFSADCSSDLFLCGDTRERAGGADESRGEAAGSDDEEVSGVHERDSD